MPQDSPQRRRLPMPHPVRPWLLVPVPSRLRCPTNDCLLGGPVRCRARAIVASVGQNVVLDSDELPKQQRLLGESACGWVPRLGNEPGRQPLMRRLLCLELAGVCSDTGAG
jgi:hypothetical protein